VTALAEKYFIKAAQLDPQNEAYKQALLKLALQRQGVKPVEKKPEEKEHGAVKEKAKTNPKPVKKKQK